VTAWISGCGRLASWPRATSRSEETVRLEVTLPWLLHKFATAVQKTVSSRGRILLEKK